MINSVLKIKNSPGLMGPELNKIKFQKLNSSSIPVKKLI